MALSNVTAYRLGIAICIGSAASFSFGSLTAYMTKRYWGTALALLLVAASIHMLREIWRAWKGVTKHFEVRGGALYDCVDLSKQPVALNAIREIRYHPRSAFVTLVGSDRQALARIHIDNPISGHFIKIEDRGK